MTIDFKPGDTFTVLLDGKPYPTYIDEKGTQRFVGNKILSDSMNLVFDTQYTGPILDLHALAIDYHKGKYTLEEMTHFYTDIQYSVSGFSTLGYFEEMEILNPLWVKGPRESISIATALEVFDLLGKKKRHARNFIVDSVIYKELATGNNSTIVPGDLTIEEAFERYFNKKLGGVDKVLSTFRFSAEPSEAESFLYDMKEARALNKAS